MPAERRFRKIRHLKKRAFLAAFARLGTVTHAAEAAGINRDTHSDWLRSDPEYAAAFAEARAAFADRLEQEAIRRAVEGCEEPIYQGGELVGTRLRFSDRLMELLLKGHLPDKYRERQEVRITGGGDPIRVVVQQLTPEQLQALAAEAEDEGAGK